MRSMSEESSCKMSQKKEVLLIGFRWILSPCGSLHQQALGIMAILCSESEGVARIFGVSSLFQTSLSLVLFISRGLVNDLLYYQLTYNLLPEPLQSKFQPHGKGPSKNH